MSRRGFMRRAPHVGRVRVGFTLIELLVVVSIISLLISILLPSLRRAREQAKQVVCLSSLRGIATASITYSSEDRQGAAVPIHPLDIIPSLGFVGAYEWGGKAGAGEPTDGNDITSSPWGTQFGRGPASRPLNRILYKGGLTDYQNDPGPGQANWISDAKLDLDLYRCPSDRGYQGLHYIAWANSGLSSYDHYGNSFATNIFWIGTVGASNCRMRSNSPYLRPLSRVPNPARTLYYEENVGRFAWMRAPDPCPIGGVDGIPSRAKGWHGKWWQFDAAFADGHAAQIKMDGYRPEHLSHYPLEADFDSYQCVIVRGDGWQKDTLPSPDVPTNHACPHEGRPSQEGPFGVGD